MIKRIFLLLLLLVFFSVPAKAAEFPDLVRDSGFDDLYRAYEDVSGERFTTSDDYAEALSRGDESFFSALKSALSSAFPNVIKELSLLIAVILLSAVLKAAGEAFHSGSSGEIFRFASTAVTVLILFQFSKEVFTVCRVALGAIRTFMQTMLAVMCCFWGYGGNFVYGAKSAGAVTLILQITAFIESSLLMPILYLCFGLTFIGAVSGYRFGAVIALLKKVTVTLCTVGMTVISIILAYQGILGKTADSLIKRGVQFGASSFIPIVGGAVSESLDALSGSLSLVKDLSGITGVMVLLLIAAPPLLVILLNKLFLSVGKMLCELLSLDDSASILSNVGDLMSILFALMLSVGLILVIACGIFMMTLHF